MNDPLRPSKTDRFDCSKGILNYLPLSQINACILSHFVTSHEENMSSGRRLTQSPLEEPLGSPFPQLVYSAF